MLFQIKPRRRDEETTSSMTPQPTSTTSTSSSETRGLETQMIQGESGEIRSAKTTGNIGDSGESYHTSPAKGTHNQVLFGNLNLNVKNIAILGGILVFGFYIYKSAIGEGVLIQQNGMTTRRNVMIWIDVVIATSLAFLIIRFSRTLLRGV